MTKKRAPGGGRKRLPTNLHLLHGNPGGRELPKDEPKPKIRIPTMPTHFNRYAKAEWKRITPHLALLKLLSDIDYAAVTAYCDTFGDYIEVRIALKKMKGAAYPIKVPDPETGRLKTTGEYGTNERLVRMSRQLLGLLKSYMTEFGMTPSSRSGIISGDDDADGTRDEYEEWLKHG